jgi:ATP-dependent Clp protease ATP-binding subunit ClpC
MSDSPESLPSRSPVLDEFGRNLTAEAREGKLEPVRGRQSQIERIMQVFSRSTRLIPVLVGEPGVGTTGVVERFAQMIVMGEVLEAIKDKQLYMLDLVALAAASKDHAESEERWRKS